jgi:hypothetical protein
MNKRRIPLIADKELFRLWYEFYRLALQSTDTEVKRALRKSKDFYKDWEASTETHFDDWWSKHRHLFEQRDLVRILQAGEKPAEGSLVIEVPLNRPNSELIAEIRELLPRTRKKVIGGAKYLPTEIQGVKRESLRMMLDLEKRIFSKTTLKGWELYKRVHTFFESERYKRKKNRVPQSFFIDWTINAGENSENAERNLRRYRQKVKKLILNVANEKFPGKY